MPLRDHFRPPLADSHPWETVHDNWLVKMVDRLNESVLPGRYLAQSGRHLGAQVEPDVATMDRDAGVSLSASGNGHGGVAVAPRTYAPPAPPLTGEVGFADPAVFEVKVYRGRGGWNLVAAVELVGEANKDRAEHRRAFAVKCASFLQAGVAVVTVDPVTNRSADLHEELCDLLRLPAAFRWTSPSGIQAVSYRVVRRGPRIELDVWPHPLGVGELLPTVPLWLAADLAVPLELEPTYVAACRSLRLD